jgi:TorA maturation chaperone TorD
VASGDRIGSCAHTGQTRKHIDLNNVDDAVRTGQAALLDLLADLLLHELDAPIAAAIAADPMLSSALEPPRNDETRRELRATYTRLFLIDMPPYASVYLDIPPVIGGETSLRWEQSQVERGQQLLSLERAAAPDHAGLYLRALAAAVRNSAPEPVLRETFRWLPQALTTIRRIDRVGFYARVAELVTDVLQTCAGTWRSEDATITAEEPTEPEDDGLREITRWLSTPALSGWALSKHTLRRLAKSFGVSVGMVDRDRMLEQVFEASALDNRISELLDALLEEWQCWRLAQESWRRELCAWAYTLDPWETRLQHTHATLLRMRSSVLTT